MVAIDGSTLKLTTSTAQSTAGFVDYINSVLNAGATTAGGAATTAVAYTGDAEGRPSPITSTIWACTFAAALLLMW